jgi:hypothetical protein
MAGACSWRRACWRRCVPQQCGSVPPARRVPCASSRLRCRSKTPSRRCAVATATALFTLPARNPRRTCRRRNSGLRECRGFLACVFTAVFVHGYTKQLFIGVARAPHIRVENANGCQRLQLCGISPRFLVVCLRKRQSNADGFSFLSALRSRRVSSTSRRRGIPTNSRTAATPLSAAVVRRLPHPKHRLPMYKVSLFFFCNAL